MVHIGIDLGTTNSVVAYVEDGDANIVENSDSGDDTTPSVVMVDHDEEGERDITVGRAALSKRVTEPEKIITRAKDHMGETDENDDPVMLEADGDELRPEEVSAYILRYLVEDAKEKVDDVDGAVVTVPYYFNEQARQATRRAAELADLDLDRLMNEPTAAIEAYSLEEEDFTGTALVYDLGGGTFDATLVEVEEEFTEVLGTNGRRDLGGETFDDELYEFVVDEILDQGLMDPGEHAGTEQSVREAVVDAKEDFSNMNSTTIDLLIGTDQFQMEITEQDLRNAIGHHIDETLDALDELFADEKVDATQSDVDEVILVGGSTRIPLVETRVENYFGLEANKSVSPDKAVAIGAAVEARKYDPDNDLEPIEEGEDEDGGDGGGDGTNRLPGGVVDVLSHSLGVEAYEEGDDEDDEPIFDPILEKNETVPHEETEVYQTMRDGQTTITSRILQGEGEMANDPENEELATFTLSDIEPRPAEETLIDVTFTVDDEGMLEAEAEDRKSGEKVTIELEDPLSLDEQEKADMKDDMNIDSLRRRDDDEDEEDED